MSQPAYSMDYDTETETNDSSAHSNPSDDSFLEQIAEKGRQSIRERPLAIVGGAAAIGFVVGTLSPRVIAQPLGLLILKRVLTNVFGDD